MVKVESAGASVDLTDSETLPPEDLQAISAELTQLKAAFEEIRREIREMARMSRHGEGSSIVTSPQVIAKHSASTS